MAYVISNARIGVQAIATTDTVQNHPLGTIVHASDPTYGEGEFIYLKGVANTAVGSPVVYNTSNYLTTLAPVGTNKPQPIAFAMSANVASQYGWYQISGNAIAKKTSGLALGSNVAVGILTAGLVAGTGSGKEIEGALTVAKSTASTTVQLIINRPRMQGRVT
jgi:hypothetical protein